MRKTVAGAAALILLLGVTGSASAQKFGAWGGQVFAGYPVAMGKLSDFTSGSFSWGAGAVYSPEAAAWALRLDIRNSRFGGKEDVIRNTLDSLGIEDAYSKDGYVRTWDFMLSGELGTNKANKFRAYALGGIGYSNKYSALTEPALVSGCYWDPWWGYICGSGVGDAIIAKRNVWEFSWNAGGGVSMDVGRGARLFLEAVYTNIGGSDVEVAGQSTKSEAMTYVPIYLGVRF